jgi:hypothetical protein
LPGSFIFSKKPPQKVGALWSGHKTVAGKKQYIVLVAAPQFEQNAAPIKETVFLWKT